MAKLSFLQQFAKNFAQNNVLVPHLNNYFMAAKWPDELSFVVRPNKERDRAFHPSSAFKCMRTIYVERQGDLEQLPSLELQKSFLFGHFFHTVIQWIVVEGLKFASWEDVEKEYNYHFKTPRGNDLHVRGFADIARCVIPDEGTFLVDIKTINSRAFNTNPIPDYLVERYAAQVRFYLEFEDLEEAIILLCEKDSPHNFKEIRIKRDGDFVDSTLKNWESVVDMEVEGIIPPCTCLDPSKCPTVTK